MTEKLKDLLKKTFVDRDIKEDALNAKETNLRHTISANTVFDHPSKWLLDCELENQCIDWVYHFLMSKEFPDCSAAKIVNKTKIRVFSDVTKIEELKSSQGGVNKISTAEFESLVAGVLQILCREIHRCLDNNTNYDYWIDDDYHLVNDVSVHAIKNTRRKMEDKHVVLRNYSTMFGLPAEYSFYAVFDGHGGVDAARFSSAHLSGILAKLLKENKDLNKKQNEESTIKTGRKSPNLSSYKSLNPPPNKSLNSPQIKLLNPPLNKSLNSPPNKSPNSILEARSKLLVPLRSECRKSFEFLNSVEGLKKVQRSSYHESNYQESVETKNKINVEFEKTLKTDGGGLMGGGGLKDGGGDLKGGGGLKGGGDLKGGGGLKGGGDDSDISVRRALEHSILETDRMFCERARIDNNNSGCTAVCILIEETCKRFHLGWSGDSQALLVRGGKPVEIMVPHKPEREDEKTRITGLGGSVVHFGTWRVNGAISVSRAIGDISYKPYITAQPDVCSFAIQSDDEYLVLACDGLWDVLSCDDVIDHVTNHVTVEKMERKTVAQALVKAAKVKGSSDNITVIVVFLGADSTSVSTSRSNANESQIDDGSSNSKKESGKGNSRNSGGDDNDRQKDGNAGSENKSYKSASGEFSMLSLKSDIISSYENESKTESEHFVEIPTKESNIDKNESKLSDISTSNVMECNDKIIQENVESPSISSTSSPKMTEEVDISELTTNNDSKENYLVSSSEIPLEFSPLRSDLKAEHETSSLSSVKSRAKRSPRISSDDKEDKENIDLRLCLKIDTTPSGSSDASHKMTEIDRKSTKESKLRLFLTRDLKETSLKKDILLAKTPDSKETGLPFRALAIGKQKHPTNLHVSKGSANSFQHPAKHPFLSASVASVGFLKDSYRKFSQTSGHIKKLDLTPTSGRPPSNFGSCGLSDNKARSAGRERWAVAVETGEDLEGMFEFPAEMNVSSTRW